MKKMLKWQKILYNNRQQQVYFQFPATNQTIKSTVLHVFALFFAVFTRAQRRTQFVKQSVHALSYYAQSFKRQILEHYFFLLHIRISLIFQRKYCRRLHFVLQKIVHAQIFIHARLFISDCQVVCFVVFAYPSQALTTFYYFQKTTHTGFFSTCNFSYLDHCLRVIRRKNTGWLTFEFTSFPSWYIFQFVQLLVCTSDIFQFFRVSSGVR